MIEHQSRLLLSLEEQTKVQSDWGGELDVTSGNVPALTLEPEMGSSQVCVTFLSLHILSLM